MRKGETGDDDINAIEVGKFHKDKFLQDLSVDHPDVARDIGSRVQEWKKAVDEKSGIDGFGQAIVDNMVYIQKEEIKEFVVSILEELRDIWRENPDKPIRFVATDEQKGSGKWFYDLVSNLLTEEEKQKDIQLQACYNIVGDTESVIEPTYIYMDDSANSGQQVQQGIYSFRGLVRSAGYGHIDINQMKTHPVDLRIRLMRMTDKVRSFIDGQIQYFQEDGNSLVTVDLNGNELANKVMPTMDQVIRDKGKSEDEVKSSGLFFYGHHQRRPSILGVFWHRAQDNMPIVMSEGRLSDHFSPLITLENEKQIKVQY